MYVIQLIGAGGVRNSFFYYVSRPNNVFDFVTSYEFARDCNLPVECKKLFQGCRFDFTQLLDKATKFDSEDECYKTLNPEMQNWICKLFNADCIEVVKSERCR